MYFGLDSPPTWSHGAHGQVGGDPGPSRSRAGLTASGFPQIRTLSYCCQLVGGALVVRCPARSDVGTRLLELSSQLSRCRTVLRLFDDAAMFIYTKQYGLGAEVMGGL